LNLSNSKCTKYIVTGLVTTNGTDDLLPLTQAFFVSQPAYNTKWVIYIYLYYKAFPRATEDLTKVTEGLPEGNSRPFEYNRTPFRGQRP
jgi:hypothetical protein